MENVIAEIYKRENSSYAEKCAKKGEIAFETVELEKIYNNDPFNNEAKNNWEVSLNKLFVWCNSNWDETNSYIRYYRENIS
jgi:hypothetical protein